MPSSTASLPAPSPSYAPSPAALPIQPCCAAVRICRAPLGLTRCRTPGSACPSGCPPHPPAPPQQRRPFHSRWPQGAAVSHPTPACTAWHGTSQHGSAQHSTAQHSVKCEPAVQRQLSGHTCTGTQDQGPRGRVRDASHSPLTWLHHPPSPNPSCLANLHDTRACGGSNSPTASEQSHPL